MSRECNRRYYESHKDEIRKKHAEYMREYRKKYKVRIREARFFGVPMSLVDINGKLLN